MDDQPGGSLCQGEILICVQMSTIAFDSRGTFLELIFFLMKTRKSGIYQFWEVLKLLLNHFGRCTPYLDMLMDSKFLSKIESSGQMEISIPLPSYKHFVIPFKKDSRVCFKTFQNVRCS